MYLKTNKNKYDIIIATNFSKRLMGLMGKTNIDYGMLFPKCNSIHTYFMKENIDIIMTDINGNVLYTYKDFRSNKIILPKKNVYYTFEFPANKINLNKKKINIDF